MAVATAEIECKKPTAEEIAAFYESPTNHAQGLTPGAIDFFMKKPEPPGVNYRLTEPVLEALGDVSIESLNALRAHDWDGKLVKGIVARTKGEMLVVKNGVLDLVTAEMGKKYDPYGTLKEYIEGSTNLQMTTKPNVVATVVEDRFWVTYVEAFCETTRDQWPILSEGMSFMSIRKGPISLNFQELKIPPTTRRVMENYSRRAQLTSGFNPISGPEIRSG